MTQHWCENKKNLIVVQETVDELCIIEEPSALFVESMQFTEKGKIDRARANVLWEQDLDISFILKLSFWIECFLKLSIFQMLNI